MNISTKVLLFVGVVALGLFGAYLTRPLPNPDVVKVDKKQLYELTYEWALYREVSTILYAQKWHVSKEVARKHLEEGVKDAVATQFEEWYKNQIREKK